jgi:hypothetical protein
MHPRVHDLHFFQSFFGGNANVNEGLPWSLVDYTREEELERTIPPRRCFDLQGTPLRILPLRIFFSTL